MSSQDWKQSAFRYGKDFLAGGLAGAAQISSSYPFDTIKTRLQAERDSGKLRAGIVDTLRKTVKYEGFRGLYKGMLAPVVGIGFLNSLLFSANGQFRSLLSADGAGDAQRMTLLQIGAAGSLAGIAQSWAAAPIELVKTKLQTQYIHSESVSDKAAPKQYAGPLDCARQIVRCEGARGLFKGMTATLLREVTGYAAFYATFEYLRRVAVSDGQSVDDLNPLLVMLCGGSAGVAYWTACYPFDTLKTLMQNQPETHRLYSSTYDCYRQLVAKEGHIGLVRGYMPAAARAIPAASSTFLVFTLLSKYMNT